MSVNLQLSKGSVLLLIGSVLIAAFLGVSAGTYFIQWNSGRKRDTQFKENLLLKAGHPFPQGSFLGMDGRPYNLEKELNGRKTVLIFFTTECPHCEVALKKWAEYYPNIDSKYRMAAISYEPVEKLHSYKTEKNLGFPILNDSIGKFTGAYKIEVYPTIIGVNERREIAFVEIGNNPKKSVEDYLRGL